MVHIRNLSFIWMTAFAIIVLASVTSGMSGLKVYGIDIMFHIGIYAMFAFLSILVFRKFETVILPVSVTMVSALFFEILHGFISGYGFEDGDYLLNNLGILIGTAAAVVGIRLFGKDFVAGEHIRERTPAGPAASEHGTGAIFKRRSS
jgi:hypothetical protein